MKTMRIFRTMMRKMSSRDTMMTISKMVTARMTMMKSCLTEIIRARLNRLKDMKIFKRINSLLKWVHLNIRLSAIMIKKMIWT